MPNKALDKLQETHPRATGIWLIPAIWDHTVLPATRHK